MSLFAKEYMTIDEYIQVHPNEKEKMFNFGQVIKKDPIKILYQNKPIKISIIYPSNEISDYWRRSTLSFEKRLQLLNIDYVLDENFIDVHNSSLQSLKIKEALSKQSDYLIFTLDINTHKKLITQLLSRKKPKIIIQNVTTPLQEWEGNQPFLYVGFDHIEGTKLLVQYFKKQFPQGANYAMLYFTQGYVSDMRGDSFISLSDGAFTLLSSYYTEGKAKNAYNATKEILQKYKNLDFIYSCATDISIGTLEALREGDKKILLNGWGGGSMELELIKEKQLHVSVMRMNDDNGIAMAEAIKFDLENKFDSIPQIYSGSFVLIDQNTTQEKLQTYINYAFRYSGK
jgi:autoinducer 2-binding protein LuxP